MFDFSILSPYNVHVSRTYLIEHTFMLDTQLCISACIGIRTLLSNTCPSVRAGDSEDVHFTVGEALAMAFGGITVTTDEILLTDMQSLAAHYSLLGGAGSPPPTAQTGATGMDATGMSTDSILSASMPTLYAKCLCLLFMPHRRESLAWT